MAFKSMPCGKFLFYQQKQYVAKAFYSFVGTAVMVDDNKELFRRILNDILDRFQFALPELDPDATLPSDKP